MTDHKHQIKTEINKLKQIVAHHYKLRHTLSSSSLTKDWLIELRNKQNLLTFLSN